MTTLFEQRERAFESLFAHEEELRFLALVRRNRIVGTWASGELGLSAGEAEAYTRRLVEAIASPLSDRDLVGRIQADLAEKGREAAAAEVPDRLAQAHAEAVRAVREEDRAA
jgi:hypothetical protein